MSHRIHRRPVANLQHPSRWHCVTGLQQGPDCWWIDLVGDMRATRPQPAHCLPEAITAPFFSLLRYLTRAHQPSEGCHYIVCGWVAVGCGLSLSRPAGGDVQSWSISSGSDEGGRHAAMGLKGLRLHIPPLLQHCLQLRPKYHTPHAVTRSCFIYMTCQGVLMLLTQVVAVVYYILDK